MIRKAKVLKKKYNWNVRKITFAKLTEFRVKKFRNTQNSYIIDFIRFADSVNEFLNSGKTPLPQTKIFKGILDDVHETEN